MTITRKNINFLDSVIFAFTTRIEMFNVQLCVDNLFYRFCVDSYEYVIHFNLRQALLLSIYIYINNSVVVGSNHAQANFLYLLQIILQWSIPCVSVNPLHSCDYLKKISTKINVATDEGNSRNKT